MQQMLEIGELNRRLALIKEEVRILEQSLSEAKEHFKARNRDEALERIESYTPVISTIRQLIDDMRNAGVEGDGVRFLALSQRLNASAELIRNDVLELCGLLKHEPVLRRPEEIN